MIAYSFPADRRDGDIFLQKFKRCDVTTQRSSGFNEEVFVMLLDKSPREQGQRQPGVSYTSEAAALAVSCSRLKAAA